MFIIKFIIKVVASFLIVFFLIGLLIALSLPSPEELEQGLTDLKTEVANDFEAQYQAAKQHGSAVDVCVRAGLVAEGYLQAGNQVKYSQWKSTEKADCLAAGVAR